MRQSHTSSDLRFKTHTESLIELSAEAFGSMISFLPDTPWTTATVQVLQMRRGKVLVDATESPLNLVVVVPGDGTADLPHEAYLFGVPTADALRTFVEAARPPFDFVCDDDLAAVVREFHPGATAHEYVVNWLDRLEVQEFDTPVPVRRLRLTDAPSLAELLPRWAWRSFESVKDLLMLGSGYGVEEGGRVVAAAVTLDHSVKYERFAVFTAEDCRRRGYASACGQKLMRSATDQGRLPCATVPMRSGAGRRLANRLGLDQRALLRTFSIRSAE